MIRLFVRSILFTLLVPGIIAVAFPWLITHNMSINEGMLFIVAIIVMLSGIVVYSWCVWNFVVFGRGTPAPIDAPKKLVTSGLYNYTRNPMYLSVFFFISGWVLLFFHWSIVLYGATILTCIQMLVIFYEEPILYQLFGNEYLRYKKTVNRWLF